MDVIVGLMGNAVVLVALWGLWISRNNPRRFLEITGDLSSAKRGWAGPQPWHEKFFHLAFGLGVIAFTFGGVYTTLSWVPDSWGTLGEDGEWSPTRLTLSILLVPPLAIWFYDTVRQNCIRRCSEAEISNNENEMKSK